MEEFKKMSNFGDVWNKLQSTFICRVSMVVIFTPRYTSFVPQGLVFKQIIRIKSKTKSVTKKGKHKSRKCIYSVQIERRKIGLWIG